MSSDPFRHHPGLRDLITDPAESFFRDFDPATLQADLESRGIANFLLSTEEREASRIAALGDRRDRDLWVFAYGSLMWDPGFLFEEVRRAHVPTHARRFILRDIWGGRGDQDRPGLMAALDTGTGCDGLVFRIARDRIEEETARLWRRERAGSAYLEAFVDARLDDGTVNAVTFVADHGSEAICPGLTRPQQIDYIVTGSGFLGTSFDYLRNLAAHFRELKIDDAEVFGLLADAETRGGEAPRGIG